MWGEKFKICGGSAKKNMWGTPKKKYESWDSNRKGDIP